MLLKQCISNIKKLRRKKKGYLLPRGTRERVENRTRSLGNTCKISCVNRTLCDRKGRLERYSHEGYLINVVVMAVALRVRAAEMILGIFK